MSSWYIKPGWSGTKAGTEVAPYATGAELEANATYVADTDKQVYVAESTGSTIGALTFTLPCTIRPWETYNTHVKCSGLVSLGTLGSEITVSNISSGHWLLEGADTGIGSGANGMAMLHIDFYTRLHRCGLPAASFRRVASQALSEAATDAAFFYDNATGAIHLSAPGSGSADFPGTTIHYTTGNGGVDYSGITLNGAGRWTIYDPDVHAVGHRTNNGGNCILHSGGAESDIICTKTGCRVIYGDDHCIFYGAGNGQAQYSRIYGNGKLLVGGLTAHEGDSPIVYYASTDNLVQNHIASRYTLVMSLVLAWDGLYDGKVLKGDTTTSYTIGQWGVTGHVNGFTLSRRMLSILHHNVRCIINPKSWSATATDGYPIPGVYEPFFIRDAMGRQISPERLNGAVGRAVDWTVEDGIGLRYESSNSSNIWIRPRLYMTGAKRTGDTTKAFMNISEGVFGGSSGTAILYDEMEVVDGVIFTNAERSADGTGIVFRNGRNSSMTGKDRRRVYRRCIILWNTEIAGGNDQRFINDGATPSLTSADYATPGGTAANWKATVNDQSYNHEFEDCIFVFLGASSVRAFGVCSHGGMAPTIEQFKRRCKLTRCRWIGFQDGKLSDIATINANAEQGVIYAGGSAGDGNNGEIFNPGATFGAPTGWPTNLFQTPTHAQQDTDGYVTFEKVSHGIPNGARVNIEGCSDDSANGVFTAVYVDDDFFKVYTGKSGSSDIVQASTRVTWLDFPVLKSWFESRALPATKTQIMI